MEGLHPVRQALRDSGCILFLGASHRPSDADRILAMQDRVPLFTLLSQALVAFTIEFDNEAEHRMPHHTTGHGRAGEGAHAPWLVSMGMWFNCLCWLENEGLTVGELESRARTFTNLDGMRRWGYVDLIAPPNASPAARPNGKWRIKARPPGRMAQQVWGPLFGVIEERWSDRFGGLDVDALHRALAAIVVQLDPGLPDCMPILGYGLVCPPPSNAPKPDAIAIETMPLPSLLAHVLLAFALEFEHESPLSLAISANPLRVLGAVPVRARDLPALTGVSKESLEMAMGILRKAKLVHESKDGAWQVVSLTERGLNAQRAARARIAELERNWAATYQLVDLRAALEPIVGDGTRAGSPLFQGLEPYPDGWRAQVPQADVLPHFPIVLHRGGYPDGS
jgi:DNA-binding transcriptional ArsR family regulator